MLFRYTSKKPLTKHTLFMQSIKKAALIIRAYPFHASELELNQILLAKYKQGLKAICLGLLRKLQVDQPNANEVLYTFKDPEDDKLARFITYGDGKVQGSTILLDAFEITKE